MATLDPITQHVLAALARTAPPLTSWEAEVLHTLRRQDTPVLSAQYTLLVDLAARWLPPQYHRALKYWAPLPEEEIPHE